jgi:hypothetical protein
VIGLWVQQADLVKRVAIPRLQPASGARVYRKDHRHGAGHAPDGAHDRRQAFGCIDVRWAMNRHQRILALRHAHLLARPLRPGAFETVKQRIHHHVPDERDPVLIDPLAP